MRPNNVIPLKCTEDSFYRGWIEMLTPFHKLQPRAQDVAARILLQYFRFKDSISPEVTNEADKKELLKAVLWSKKSRQDMMVALGMSPEHFQMIIGKLKKADFLRPDDEINPRYIPNKLPGERRFMMQIVYDWSTQLNPIRNENQPS